MLCLSTPVLIIDSVIIQPWYGSVVPLAFFMLPPDILMFFAFLDRKSFFSSKSQRQQDHSFLVLAEKVSSSRP